MGAGRMAETLESLYSLYRPDIAAFTKMALAIGYTKDQIDTFLDAPAEDEDDEENDQ